MDNDNKKSTGKQDGNQGGNVSTSFPTHFQPPSSSKSPRRHSLGECRFFYVAKMPPTCYNRFQLDSVSQGRHFVYILPKEVFVL